MPPERRGNLRVYELRHVAAVERDLAHQCRRDEGELLQRRHEHVVDVAREVAAHVGELELELEVRHRAQAAHHDTAALLARELDGEPGVTEHRDVLQVPQHLLRELDALGEREERRLAGVGGDADHHPVEDPGRPPDQVVVAVGDGVEGARVDRAALQVHVPGSSRCRRAR